MSNRSPWRASGAAARNRRLRANAPEALHGDRFDIRANRRFGLFRPGRRPRRSLAPKTRLNVAEQRSQDQIGDAILEAFAIQPIQNLGLKKIVHALLPYL